MPWTHAILGQVTRPPLNWERVVLVKTGGPAPAPPRGKPPLPGGSSGPPEPCLECRTPAGNPRRARCRITQRTGGLTNVGLPYGLLDWRSLPVLALSGLTVRLPAGACLVPVTLPRPPRVWTGISCPLRCEIWTPGGFWLLAGVVRLTLPLWQQESKVRRVAS